MSERTRKMVVGIAVSLICGLVVMLIWNLWASAKFGIPAITYWEGLLVVMFGRFSTQTGEQNG